MASRELVAGRLRSRGIRVPSARLGLLPRRAALADADVVRRGPGDAESHRLPRAPQSAGTGDDHLDGRSAASSGQRAAHVERVHDRGMGRRRARHDHDAPQGNLHPPLRPDAQRPLRRSHAVAAHGRLPAGHVDSVRPRAHGGAVHSNHDDVGRRSHARRGPVSVRRGDGGGRAAEGKCGTSFPGRACCLA